MSAPQAALKVHAHERDDGLESKQIKGFSKSSKFFVRVAIMVGILIAPLIVDTASGRAPRGDASPTPRLATGSAAVSRRPTRGTPAETKDG